MYQFSHARGVASLHLHIYSWLIHLDRSFYQQPYPITPTVRVTRAIHSKAARSSDAPAVGIGSRGSDEVVWAGSPETEDEVLPPPLGPAAGGGADGEPTPGPLPPPGDTGEAGVAGVPEEVGDAGDAGGAGGNGSAWPGSPIG